MAADAVYARAEGNHNIEKLKGGQDPMQPICIGEIQAECDEPSSAIKSQRMSRRNFPLFTYIASRIRFTKSIIPQPYAAGNVFPDIGNGPRLQESAKCAILVADKIRV